MQITRTKFQRVAYAHKIRIGTGRNAIVKQKTFEQTMNPFNVNSEGQPKSFYEIMKELKEEAARWEKEVREELKKSSSASLTIRPAVG